MYEYNAVIENVIDGDTFDLNVDLGFDIWHRVRVRLLDIDTPETRNIKGNHEKEYGLICKNYARKHYLGRQCVIRSYIDKEAKIDSFGRYLVYCTVDGENLVDTYNRLGINKRNDTYSLKLIEELGNLTELTPSNA